MEFIKKNRMLDLVNLPLGRKAIGNKWLLKVKHKEDRSIERYKTLLVANGYTQIENVDYEKTFISSDVCLNLHNSSYFHSFGLGILPNRVKPVFINGEIDEEIYYKKFDPYLLIYV